MGFAPVCEGDGEVEMNYQIISTPM
jgi:hypothetical protein